VKGRILRGSGGHRSGARLCSAAVGLIGLADPRLDPRSRSQPRRSRTVCSERSCTAVRTTGAERERLRRRPSRFAGYRRGSLPGELMLYATAAAAGFRRPTQPPGCRYGPCAPCVPRNSTTMIRRHTMHCKSPATRAGIRPGATFATRRSGFRVPLAPLTNRRLIRQYAASSLEHWCPRSPRCAPGSHLR
jgi:hypothetical protein